MSIEPCQICGGTGFIQVPIEGHETPADEAEAGVDPQSVPVRDVPCPSCSGSGVSAGL